MSRIKRKFFPEDEQSQFRTFNEILTRYNVRLCFKDSLGIVTAREPSDNFKFMFQTGFSCDAVPMMEKLKDKVFPAETCFDIGANIGITTIWLAKNAKKVFAFEPISSNLTRLTENLELNHIQNVEVFKEAVSDMEGSREIFLYNSYGHHSLSPEHVSAPVSKEIIHSVTLDNFCREKSVEKIDVLKIDVEGFELEVLSGAHELLSKHCVKYIIFEHSRILMEKQQRPFDQVYQLLTKYGYRVFDLNDKQIKQEDFLKLGQEDLYATV
jgi:FkbM family methyltransferase